MTTKLKHILIAALVTVAVFTVTALAVIYGVSQYHLSDVETNTPFSMALPSDPEAIERGRHIARTRGCFGCHGQQLEGKDFGELWDWPRRAVAPNLAAYAKNQDVATIEAAIRQGIDHKGRALVSMPSYNFTRLTDADTAALIAFLQQAPVVELDPPLPAPALGLAARFELITGMAFRMSDLADMVPELRLDPVAQPQLARGEYLAMTTCNECHGLDVRGFRQPYFSTPDLAMVAAYSREQFETLLTTGVTMAGRRLELMGLVGPDRFKVMSAEDMDALYAYLASLADEPVPSGVAWRVSP